MFQDQGYTYDGEEPYVTGMPYAYIQVTSKINHTDHNRIQVEGKKTSQKVAILL